MAILFCHKSHITCPSEKMKIGKDEDGKFQGRFRDSTMDYTFFLLLYFSFSIFDLIDEEI